MSAIPKSHNNRFVDPPADLIVRYKATARLLGIGPTTLWRWVKDGKFPAPIKLSRNVAGYRQSTINAWLANRELESVQAAEERA